MPETDNNSQQIVEETEDNEAIRKKFHDSIDNFLVDMRDVGFKSMVTDVLVGGTLMITINLTMVSEEEE